MGAQSLCCVYRPKKLMATALAPVGISRCEDVLITGMQGATGEARANLAPSHLDAPALV